MIEIAKACEEIKKIYETSYWGMASTYAALFGALLTVAVFIFGLKFYYDKVGHEQIAKKTADDVAKEMGEKLKKELNEQVMLLYSPLLNALKDRLHQFNIDIITKLETAHQVMTFVNSVENEASTLTNVNEISKYIVEVLKRLPYDSIFYKNDESTREQINDNVNNLLKNLQSDFLIYQSSDFDNELQLHVGMVMDNVRYALNAIEDYLEKN